MRIIKTDQLSYRGIRGTLKTFRDNYNHEAKVLHIPSDSAYIDDVEVYVDTIETAETVLRLRADQIIEKQDGLNNDGFCG